MNQGHRSNTNNRRKNTRSANRKKQSTSSTNSNGNDEKELPSSETTNDKEQVSTVEQSQQQSDEDQEQKETTNTEQMNSSPLHVEDEPEPMILVKQRNKNRSVDKTVSLTSTKGEPVVLTKPQASVAPVKQVPLASMTNNSFNNHKSFQNQQDYNHKSNGHLSSPHNIYTYSAYNPLPPRFQRQQQEAEMASQKYRKRGAPLPANRTYLPAGSAARSNEFVPLPSTQQEEEEEQQQPQYYNHEQTESYNYPPQQQQQQQQQELSFTNGYSSESDVLTDSPVPPANNDSMSPIISTSMGSESSLQRLDLLRSLATSHGLLDGLVSIFDTISFSSDELDLILSKIATKHISNKHDLQRLLSSTKSDKTLERILEETYRSQAKILAIELQNEKNRILELTKTNADMENTIRQLLQQQQQQQPANMVQYQQMILPYQMQLQRLADENTRLQHQIHAYSMLPATINELKQQQHILTEKIRQILLRNSALENEVADSERASKHAAEIYKKADAQKQERIEQMIADINKYKKLDKELTCLRQKYNELEKNFHSQIDEITRHRDELQINCEQLKDKAQQYEQLQMKYDQLLQRQSSNKSKNKLVEEIIELKSQNDQLRQRNWKIMEDLNRLLNDQRQNQEIPAP